MNTRIKSTALAVAVAGLFAAQPAAADTLNFNGFLNGAVSATVTNSNTSAAFQLAVWEIVNESGVTNPATYSLSSGTFKATSAAATQTEIWLHGINLAGPVTQTLSVWAQPGAQGSSLSRSQDLAVFARVPEPQTYEMMLAGLGLMGFVAHRRKKEDAA